METATLLRRGRVVPADESLIAAIPRVINLPLIGSLCRDVLAVAAPLRRASRHGAKPRLTLRYLSWRSARSERTGKGSGRACRSWPRPRCF